ncbi:hypothetical protein RISK_000421 [Rhodopirellula islandica]|uniref:Uncharacterized protein n=1 Tax=Rhodopirellula islandica TaxID=595434 RepID=A0A0J1BLK7_RHOIS|nr:hypothetical protein RISK_000421 [Rhodopirellula islandica]
MTGIGLSESNQSSRDVRLGFEPSLGRSSGNQANSRPGWRLHDDWSIDRKPNNAGNGVIIRP